MNELQIAVVVVLAVQIIAGLSLRIAVPRFRGEANGLLGLAVAEIGIPALVFGLASLGYWLHPPQPSPDALGPSPWWPTLLSGYISALLLAVAAIILLKIMIQATLIGVRKLEHKEEDNKALRAVDAGAPKREC